jgi:hypothetical protein
VDFGGGGDHDGFLNVVEVAWRCCEDWLVVVGRWRSTKSWLEVAWRRSWEFLAKTWLLVVVAKPWFLTESWLLVVVAKPWFLTESWLMLVTESWLMLMTESWLVCWWWRAMVHLYDMSVKVTVSWS